MKTVLIMMSVMLVATCTAVAQDAFTGQWIAEVTESTTHCERIGKDLLGEYHLTFNLEGTELTLQGQRDHVTYHGILNPADPLKAHVQATYNEDGGYVTELVDIAFSEDGASGQGGVTWRWSDGLHQCGGSFLFILKRPEE